MSGYTLPEPEFGFASKWKSEYRCAFCTEILSSYDRAILDRCPSCGTAPDAGRLLKTTEHPYREIFTEPKLNFLQKILRDQGRKRVYPTGHEK